MATLILRNVDDVIVQALRASADFAGISSEAEHRKILERALLRPAKKNFAEALRSIPSVGKDLDFKRV